MDLNERKHYLAGLKAFISDTEAKFGIIFSQFGVQNTGITNLVRNPKVPSLKQRCPEIELDLPEADPMRRNSILIDANLQSAILQDAFEKNSQMQMGVSHGNIDSRSLPKKFSDLQINFSPAERLTLYNFAVHKTEHCVEPELNIELKAEGANTTQKVLTYAEIFNRRRDLKRRRMKYRGTKGPPLTHTEEKSKLIGAQMEAYQEYLNQGKSDRVNVKAADTGDDPLDLVQLKVERSATPRRHVDDKKSKKSKKHRSRSREKCRKSRNRSRDKHPKSRERSRERRKSKKHKRSRSSSRSGHRKEKKGRY